MEVLKLISDRLEAEVKLGKVAVQNRITGGNGQIVIKHPYYEAAIDGTLYSLKVEDYTLKGALTYIYIHRGLSFRIDKGIGERVAWATVGWDGNYSHASPFSLNKIIKPSPLVYKSGLEYRAGVANPVRARLGLDPEATPIWNYASPAGN